MRANEFFVERRDAMFQFVKSVLPKWPDYVLKDWIYGLARGDHQAGAGGWAEDPEWGFNRRTILKMIAENGLSPDTQWQLVPNMKFTLDMFDPKSKQKLIGRAGGHSDLGMGILRDKERHATQAALAQQQGGVRKEPVLLLKTATGYELLEGWHRTIQHFHMYPDGYTGPAYVAVSQGQQGVAEGRGSGYKEIEFVCANPEFPNATDHALQKQMYAGLQKIPGVIPLFQDQSDYSEGQYSLTAIYKDPPVRGQILKLAKQLGVSVDLERPVTDDYVDRAVRGEHEGQQGVVENRLGTLHLGPLTIEIDDHALDRARQRGIDPYAVDRILKKLTTRLDKLEKIELGERFWVYDLTSNIALGIRRLNNNRYYLKTMIGTQPQLMPGISKIITLKL